MSIETCSNTYKQTRKNILKHVQSCMSKHEYVNTCANQHVKTFYIRKVQSLLVGDASYSCYNAKPDITLAGCTKLTNLPEQCAIYDLTGWSFLLKFKILKD